MWSHKRTYRLPDIDPSVALAQAALDYGSHPPLVDAAADVPAVTAQPAPEAALTRLRGIAFVYFRFRLWFSRA